MVTGQTTHYGNKKILGITGLVIHCVVKPHGRSSVVLWTFNGVSLIGPQDLLKNVDGIKDYQGKSNDKRTPYSTILVIYCQEALSVRFSLENVTGAVHPL